MAIDFNKIKLSDVAKKANTLKPQKTSTATTQTQTQTTVPQTTKTVVTTPKAVVTTPTPTQTVAPTATISTVAPQPAPAYNSNMEMINQYSKLLGNVSETSPEMSDIKKRAAEEYQRQITAIQNQQNALKELQTADINALQQNQDLARKRLEDTMFERYLQTQNNMNRRGLLGSGFTQDAMTRLGMNRQDELANLYAQTQDNINAINRTYQPQLVQLASQQSGISQQGIEQSLLQNLYKQRADQADAMAKLLPYTTLTENQRQSLSQQRVDSQAKASAKATSPSDYKALITQSNNQVKNALAVAEDYRQMAQNAADPATQKMFFDEFNRQNAIAKAASAKADAYSKQDPNLIMQAEMNFDSLNNPAPVAQPKLTGQAGLAAAASTGRFTQLQDNATILTSGNPAQSMRQAIQLARQTGTPVKIPQSRFDQIKGYVQGTDTGSVWRSIGSKVGATSNQTVIRNAKNVWDELGKANFGTDYVVVPDAVFDADYAE